MQKMEERHSVTIAKMKALPKTCPLKLMEKKHENCLKYLGRRFGRKDVSRRFITNAYTWKPVHDSEK